MATAKKSSSKKSSARKTPAKKAVTKKTASKKSPAKTSVKKVSAKRPSVKKTSAKKTVAGKTSAKKSSAKKSGGRKYDPSVGKRVEREMHEMHRGTLKSGRSNQRVTNPKQAIAIALSEKRREGAKVPPNPNRKSSRK